MEILINENINKRLDVFLLDYFDCSRNQIVSLIENNFIFVNKKNQKPSYKLKQNDFVEYDEEKISDFLNKKLPNSPNIVGSILSVSIKYLI